MHAWPIRSQTAEETRMTLFRNWFAVHVVPEPVRSGWQLRKHTISRVASLMGYKKSMTTAYHEAGNGDVERNNHS